MMTQTVSNRSGRGGLLGMTPRFAFAALLPFAIAGCVAAPPPPRPAPSPVFSPIAFFTGDTSGEGSLKIAMRRARPVHVDGHGVVGADGALVLVQHVREGDAPERTRTWRIRAEGGGRYAGTLSDAVGPVAIDARGDTTHIAYRAKGGLRIEQWLTLQSGGQAARNILMARKFGMRVAVLRETIVRR